MKRASYRHSVEWIALNDDPTNVDLKEVSEQITTILVADIFEKDALDVALAIIKFRRTNGVSL